MEMPLDQSTLDAGSVRTADNRAPRLLDTMLQQAVIVIEDDEGLSRLMRKALRRQGVDPVGVRTAAEAIEWLRSNSCDLMLLDYALPDMRAPELLGTLDAQGKRLEFIVVTGQGDEKLAVQMMKRGARDYLVKDSNMLDLLPHVVERVLKDIHNERQLAAAQAERDSLEIHLREKQKLAAIGTLAGGVAHEINNPINGIINYAQLILDAADNGSTTCDYARGILEESQRVAAIVRDLLAFSRGEGKTRQRSRIADVVHGTVSLMHTALLREQIQLEVDIPADLPEVLCHPQRIKQVLVALIENARDSLNQRYRGYDPGKILRVSARCIRRDGNQWVRLTVWDGGCGIPAETRERVFDPFFTTKDRAHSAGLGLAIAHGIVEEQQGLLTVDSDGESFASFHIDLPGDSRRQG
jgi:signal transduction histidine kinase